MLFRRIHLAGRQCLRLACIFGLSAILSACGSGSDDVRERVKQLQSDYRREIQDLMVVQTAVYGSKSGEIQVYKKGEKFHTRLTGPIFNSKAETDGNGEQAPEQLAIHIIYDGNAYWRLAPVDGLSRISAQDAAAFTFRLFWWEGDIRGMTLAGRETVEDRECLVLEFKDVTSAFERLWADKQSLALVRARVNAPKGNTLELWGSSYRTIEGRFELPGRVDIMENGKPAGYIRTTQVVVNQGVDDKLFDPRQTPLPRPTKDEILEGLFPESK
jgi:hypothetical protein